MKKKLYILVGVLVVIIILTLSLLAIHNLNKIEKLSNSIDKCKVENKNLKNEINNDTINNDENILNNVNQGLKTCTYMETYEFVDYYEKNDRIFIIVDHVKALSKNNSPLVLELDKDKFKKDFIKNQSYEITLEKSVGYKGNAIMHENIDIIKIEPTDKTGMEQINEFCVFE